MSAMSPLNCFERRNKRGGGASDPSPATENSRLRTKHPFCGHTPSTKTDPQSWLDDTDKSQLSVVLNQLELSGTNPASALGLWTT